PARRYRSVDFLVAPHQLVRRRFRIQQGTSRERAVRATMAKHIEETLIETVGARPAASEAGIDRTNRLVVVQREDHRNAPIAGRADDRRRELVVDVMTMEEIRPSGVDELDDPVHGLA